MSLRSLTADADRVILKTLTRQHTATSTALRPEDIILRAICDFRSHEKTIAINVHLYWYLSNDCNWIYTFSSSLHKYYGSVNIDVHIDLIFHCHRLSDSPVMVMMIIVSIQLSGFWNWTTKNNVQEDENVDDYHQIKLIFF